MSAIESGNHRSGRECCDTSFNARRMVHELGPLSSHPAHAPLKLLVWSAVALAPLLAGILVLTLWLKDGSIDPTRFLINHGKTIAIYGLSSAGFAIGFGLTAFLATVASRSRMLAADNDVQRGPVLAVITMLFLLGIATWGIPLISGMPSQTRLLMAWLGLLPLLLLMSLATFLPHEDSAGKLVSRPFRLWALVFPVAVLAFVIATRFKMVSDWLEQVSVIQIPLKVLIDAAGTSGLQPAAIESMKSWFLTGIIAIAACPLLSLALVAMNVIGRSLGATVSRDEAAPAETGVWRAGILSSLGITQVDEIGPDDRDAMYAAADDPSGDFFVETPITADQAAALHQIFALNCRQDESQPPVPTKRCLSADFILEGADGSGKTATVIAALLQGALVLGDTAIVIVAQESKREALRERLVMAARSLGVEGFVGIGFLTPEAVSRWSDVNGHAQKSLTTADRRDTSTKDSARTATIPPRILVGTLEGLESSFFGTRYGFEALETTLSRVDTVAIEDLDSFSIQDRIHLPYVLAKLRIIRAARGQPLRTLLTTKPTADAARQLIARQLLKAASTDGHWMRMRSVPRPPHASLSITALPCAENEAAALDLLFACGRACRSQGLNVAVVAPGASRAGLADIVARCHGPAPEDKTPLLSAVADIDALPTLGSRDHALVGTAACALLRLVDGAPFVVTWKTGDPAAVAFHVQRDAVRTDAAEPRHALMVLPGKESESLFAQHFASAARFIPRLQLIPREAFSAMGLPGAGTLITRSTRYQQRPDDINTLVDRVLLLDPPDSVAELASNDPVGWSSCAIAEFGTGDPPAPRSVAIRGLLPASMGITAGPSGTTVTVLNRPLISANQEIAEHPRTVIWRSSDGSEIARDDLAYMSSFCLESEGGMFSPTRIHSPSCGPVVIDVRAVSGRSALRNPIMPAFELADLPMPSGIELRRLLQSAPLAHRVSVFGIAPQSGDSMVKAGINPQQTATLNMIGLYDNAARLREWQLRTCYEAAKFFVLFDSPDNVRFTEPHDSPFLVNWGTSKPSTHEDYPELAAAITAAMAWQAPGLERLVRCAGFQINRGDDPPLVGLLFIEPRSTESSGFALMEPIVYDLEVMHEFFDRAAAVLEEASRHEDPASVLFGLAGSAMNPKITNGRLTVQVDAIAAAAALLRSIAIEAKA